MELTELAGAKWLDSMFISWLSEYHNTSIFYEKYGFMTYIISGDNCIIYDVYIKEEYRKEGRMSELADNVTKIAKDNNCKKLIGFVNFPSPYPEYSLKAQLKYGFKIMSVENGKIILEKEI